MDDYYGNLAKDVGDSFGSDVSEGDIREMDRLVADMDDLDAELFGSSFKSPAHSPDKKPKKTATKHIPVKEDFKKPSTSPVKSMRKSQFDIDLGLTEELGDPVASQKIGEAAINIRHKNTASEDSKKSVLSDNSVDRPDSQQKNLLPKSKDTETSTKKLMPVTAGTRSNVIKNQAFRETTHTRHKDLDMLDDLGFPEEKQTPPVSVKSDSIKKINLVDELFGNKQFPERKSEPDLTFGSYSPSVVTQRSTKRSDTVRKVLPDTLGLFAVSESSIHDNIKSQKHVDWLGVPLGESVSQKDDQDETSTRVVSGNISDISLSQSKESKSATDLEWLSNVSRQTQKSSPTLKPGKPNIKNTTTKRPVTEYDTAETVNVNKLQGATSMDSLPQGLPLLSGAFEQQTLAALRRQESQLLTALHLKHHEEELTALQRRQQDTLMQQEQKLAQLIELQISRQKQIDEQMRQQQERIGSHIQLLLSQQVINPLPVLPEQLDTHERQHKVENEHRGVSYAEDSSEQQSVHSYKNILENLQAKHLEEIRLLEEMYKRQLAVTENALDQLQKRFQAENEALEKAYTVKIAKMKAEEEKVALQHRQTIEFLQNDHQQQIELLKGTYKQSLEDLKEHHSSLLAHVAKSLVSLQDAVSYNRSLKLLTEHIDKNSQDLNSLQEKFGEERESHLSIKEAELRAKNHEIEVTKDSLERQRNLIEEERKQLLTLIADLELKSSQQSMEINEKAWTLKQDESKLAGRQQAFINEEKRLEQQIQEERRRLESLKESFLEEQKISAQKIQEEQLKIAEEKFQLEALVKLYGSANNQHAAAQCNEEVESAMRIAQETSEQLEKERDQLRQERQSLEEERWKLKQFEQDLTAKAQQLEVLSQTAAHTKNSGIIALEQARSLEKCLREKSSALQKHFSELKKREKALAEDKINYSQERARWSQAQDLCPYCRPALEPSCTTSLSDKKIVDPRLVIMKLCAEKQTDSFSQEKLFIYSN